MKTKVKVGITILMLSVTTYTTYTMTTDHQVQAGGSNACKYIVSNKTIMQGLGCEPSNLEVQTKEIKERLKNRTDVQVKQAVHPFDMSPWMTKQWTFFKDLYKGFGNQIGIGK